jgi:hypothetical protein
MTTPKPALGEQVNYYDPKLPTKVGYTSGHGGRRAGPYLAFVTNDIGAGLGLLLALPEYPPFPADKVRSKEEVGDKPTEPYWDWKDGLQKARAVKRAAEADAPAEAPARDTTKHPGLG